MLLIGGLAYYLIAGRRPSALSTAVRKTPSPTPPVSLPVIPETITKISGEDIVGAYFFVNAQTGRVFFFDKRTRKLRFVSTDGKNLSDLSESVFQNVVGISWAPAGPHALLEFVSPGGKKVFSLFNYEAGRSIALSEDIRQAAWSPDGTRIIFHSSPANTKTLPYIGTVNADGSGARLLLALNVPQVKLLWPSPETAYVIEKPAKGFQNTIWRLDIKNGALSVAFNEFFGTEILPAPNGKKILITGTIDAGGNFVKTRFLDITKSPPALSPSLRLTFASKCTWGSDSLHLYCALPEQTSMENQTGGATIQKNFELPFSYWTGERATNDSFVKMNQETGEVVELIPLSGLDAQFPVLTPQRDALIFLNRSDSALYRLKL